jgi:hypothetical protein
MNDHLTKHRAEMERQAWPVVKEFVQQHPQYHVDENQSGSQSVTNYVILGHRRDHLSEQRVVFKYFCRDERKQREIFGLRHFAATGLVPQLLEDDGPRLIVVSHIPGAFLPRPEVDLAAFHGVDRQLMGYTLGEATAKLMSTPLAAQTAKDFESRFYNGETLNNYLYGILQASQAIHQRVECYKADIFAHSLALIEENLPRILAQPRLLYHQDALNMHFMGSRFSGFFDLEMCRVGTAAMQIGSLWSILVSYAVWEAFAQGFADVSGRMLEAQDWAASRAFGHFMLWRSISDYGDWRGEPLAADQMAEVVAQANGYQQAMATL